MDIGYKTLILVDNSSFVSYGSREIMKATLKYLIENAPASDDFALATYTSQTEMLVDFGHEKQDYLDAIEKISYVDKEVHLTDVLSGTVREWSEADYALRNILLISACNGLEMGTYPIEETYFTLYENAFPLYLIGLVQEDNREMLKKTASLARISHGEVFYSEFANSEAEVEKKLSEQFFNALNVRRSSYAVQTENVETEEEQAGAADADTSVDSETYSMEENYGEGEMLVSDESINRTNMFEGYPMPMLLLTLLMILAVGLFVLLIKLPGRRRKQNGDHSENSLLPMVTGSLSFEDLDHPMKFFRMPPMEQIVIGSNRKSADVCIDYDQDVNERHCRIDYNRGRFLLRDLLSTHGTYLNGNRVEGECELHSSDVITVGGAKLLVKISDRAYE